MATAHNDDEDVGHNPSTKTMLTRQEQTVVLYWPSIAKIPIILCNSKTKGFGQHQWKNVNFSQTDWNAVLLAGEYDDGIALVLGKTLPGSPYPYSFALDFDGEDAVLEFFGSWDNVLSLSKKTRIEWHQDKGRGRRITKKRIMVKETDAAFEVRSDQLLIVSPSIHGDGNAWTVLGIDEISALSNEDLVRLEAKIDALSNEGYISDEDKQSYIAWLEDPNTSIAEGGRHDAVKVLGCSYFYRHKDEWKHLTDDQRF